MRGLVHEASYPTPLPMKSPVRLPLFLALALAAVLFSPASRADSVRIPKTGDPAFAFNTPSGWEIVYDEFGNVRMTAADHTCALLVTIISDDAPDKTPMNEVAANVIKAAGAPPYSSTEDAVIAGISGKAYLTSIKKPDGMVLGLKVVLAKLDPLHYASQASLTTPNMTTAQVAALDALIQRLQLTGTK